MASRKSRKRAPGRAPVPGGLGPRYEPGRVEAEVLRRWAAGGVYRRVRRGRAGGKPFFFVDGPPYTTGRIHLGTAWNKILKDSVLRFRSMQGRRVVERAGWDMHGLPIEVKVEETLGFESKKQIEEYGVARFVARCQGFALRHRDAMARQFQRLGAWLDWEDPYQTVTPDYLEAIWWTLAQAEKRGLLEEGLRVVNWCPRCETALAEAEVEYVDLSDPSVYVRFPLVERPGVSLVVWTTTPWTLPSNLGVAVHPEHEYVEVEVPGAGTPETLILAGALQEAVLAKAEVAAAVVVKRYPGSQMAGLRYAHPLADKIPRQRDFDHRVHTASFVTLSEGTGCVHIAPGFGEEDFALGQRVGLPVFAPVDEGGRFTPEAGDYGGREVRRANREIVEDLRQAGALLHSEMVGHRYGTCWRCKTPILYRATRQWFLRVSALREEMMAAIRGVRWVPEWAGSERFANFVGESRDWCISRQRYWGAPLPIWRCGACGKRRVVGGLAELPGGRRLRGLDLHVPRIDRVKFPCACGSTMTRVPDVFDVWFDSAVASWAALGYPGRRDDFRRLWPTDFITEGHDQTRGWFFSQLGASMAAFGKAPYRTVLMHGFTLDEQGRKMSKSLGNIIEPEEVVKKYGADTLRLYVLGASAPWEDLRFSWAEAQGAFRTLNIYWNVVRFATTYMALDRFRPGGGGPKPKYRVEDRWLLARLQSLVAEVTGALESYHLHRAARALENFLLEDLSRWYIPLVRPRTWAGGRDPDTRGAYETLHRALDTLNLLLAPLVPFIAEKVHGSLPGACGPSVHLRDWPRPEKRLRDPELESQMVVARQAVEAAWKARQRAGRKLRWPVSRVVAAPGTPEAARALRRLDLLLREQTNAKQSLILEPGEAWAELGLEAIPDPAKLGPLFRQQAPEAAARLKAMEPRGLQKSLAAGVEVLGRTVTADMVSFQETPPEGVAVEAFPGGRIYVDGRVSPELKAEGYARELIRRIQEMRKERDLPLEAPIRATLHITEPHVLQRLQQGPWLDLIRQETRAAFLEFSIPKRGFRKEWDLEEWNATIGIELVRSLRRGKK